MIIETTAAEFLRWLEQYMHERVGDGGRPFITSRGNLSLEPPRFEQSPSGKSEIVIRGHRSWLSEDGMKGEWEPVVAMAFRLSKLGPARLDVVPRCDHPAVTKYYSILLMDMRKKWPRVPGPPAAAEMQVAGTKRKPKISAQARREKLAEEEQKRKIVKLANSIRDTEHLQWKEIAIRVGMNSVKTLRDWRRKYG